MAERGWADHAASIGVFEFRRSVREVWRDKARFAFMALGVVFPSLIVTVLAVVFADAIRGVEAMPIHDTIRGMVALFWLFAVYLVAQRVVSARTHMEAEALMLTTVSARTVAVGLLVAETFRILAYVGLPLLVLTGVSVALLGSPLSLVMIPVVALLYSATVVVTGSAVGYAAAWLVATSRFVARHKTILGTAATLIGMGGYFLFLFPGIAGINQAALAWVPTGWFADLAVLGTRFVGSPLLAAAIIVGSVVLLVGGGIVVERETVALWFTDPVSPESGDTSKGAELTAITSHGDGLAAAVSPLRIPGVVSKPVRRVAEWAILRTRRDPNRLMFLMIPAFAIGSPLLSTGVQSGSVGALAAPLFAVAVPWIAGASFAMNPFGDEGAVLPVTLTAVSGTQYVRGLMVPGLILGLPLVGVTTAIAGFFSPYTPIELAGLVALGVYLTCVAVTMTPAIGMAFPRYSAISVGQSRDVLPPRMTAVAVHAVLTVIPGTVLAALIVVPSTARAVLAGLFGFLPAFLLSLLAGSPGGLVADTAAGFSAIGNGIQSLGIHQVQFVGGGVLILAGGLVSLLLYRNAVRRFEQYSPV